MLRPAFHRSVRRRYFERTPDQASENRRHNLEADHGALHNVVGGKVILVGCYLADKLVEIDNTVAIADSIAPELVNSQRAEWEEHAPAGTEDVEETLLARKVVKSVQWAMLERGQDFEYTEGG